jgi:serine/threonine protein kinase
VEPSTRATRISELEGQRLGPYEIVSLIGRGGMAVVYKALQPTLRRHVAIKVLPAYFVHEEGFRTRFQQEAETAARLEHPNILPIFDYGQEGDLPYIVMPLVTGGTLREWLRNPVPLESALQVFGRILSALGYAHTRQPAIIHRDIKPSNILMSQGDWPLLTDFGIAKIVEPSLQLTRSGTMVGTPEYMSPEQSQGAAVDPRTDLYAMGILLFEMLTGRLPFQGQTPLAVILQHVRDEVPSPRSFNPDLSPIWDDVVRRALAKNPEDRYLTAQAMDDAIQTALRQAQRSGVQQHTAASADPDVLYASAARALARGDWQQVISLCGQLLEIDPAHPEAVQLLTQAHEALRRQRTTDPGAHKPQILVQQAEDALAQERFTDASRLFQEALRLDPGLSVAQAGLPRVQQAQWLAQAYHAARADIAAERWDAAAARLEQIAGAQADYRDVATLRPMVAAHRQAEAELAAWYDQGTAAATSRDWPPAIAAFRKVVERAPGYRDAAARLADAEHQRDLEQALASARATLVAGRAAEAVAQLETLVRRAPDYVEARTLLGQARAQQAPPTVAREPAAPVSRDPAPVVPPVPLTRPSSTPAGADAAPATMVGQRTQALGREAAPRVTADAPTTPPPLVPPVEPVPAEPARGGNGLKLALAGGVIALGLVAFLGIQRAQSGGSQQPTATVVAVASPAAPTATLEPTAADLFPPCEQAVAAAAWSEALTACERVRAKDAQLAGLDGALAATYTALGKEKLASGGPVSEALTLFSKALEAKPDDAEAEQQRQWAQAYLEGEQALAAENWPQATEKLDQVYTVAPDYQASAADGGLKPKLFTARLKWGQALLEAGQYADAQRRCEQALELEPENGEARNCRALALAAQATPTPRPQPTAVPVQPAQTQPQQQQQPRPQPTAVPARPQPTAVPQQPRPQPTAVPARPQPTAAPARPPPTRAPAVPAAPPTRPP